MLDYSTGLANGVLCHFAAMEHTDAEKKEKDDTADAQPSEPQPGFKDFVVRAYHPEKQCEYI